MINLCVFIFTLFEVYQDKFLEVRWLGQRINAPIVLLDITKFSSIGIVPFFIPTNSIWKYQLPCRLANKCTVKLQIFANLMSLGCILKKGTHLRTLKICNGKIKPRMKRPLERMGVAGMTWCVLHYTYIN